MNVEFIGGKKVKIGVSESLVSELKKTGLMFPHSCESGRCESCKVQLIEGETECFKQEISLSDSERSRGLILACCRKARSDLVLLAPYPQPASAASRVVPCKLADLLLVSDGLYQVEVQLPKAPTFEFLAGQHVDFIYPTGEARKYSIAKADSARNRLYFLVRLHAGGCFERFVKLARKGDLFKLRGPLGSFALDYTQVERPHIFVATGTGISVFCAMLDEMASRSEISNLGGVSLYWGVSTEGELDMFDAKAYQIDLTVNIAVSKPSVSWSAPAGRVTDLLSAVNIDLSSQVYLCGNPAMVEDVTSFFVRSGIDESSIHSDSFVASHD